MCELESVNKIAKYLKVNVGKVSYNSDKIITRTSKTNNLIGFSTILHNLSTESKEEIVRRVNDLENQCLVSQWIDFAGLYVASAVKNKQLIKPVLQQLNAHLDTRSYLVGQLLTLADLAVFFTITSIINNLTPADKDTYINVSRWYDHLQQQNTIRQGASLINLSTIHLNAWIGSAKH